MPLRGSADDAPKRPAIASPAWPGGGREGPGRENRTRAPRARERSDRDAGRVPHRRAKPLLRPLRGRAEPRANGPLLPPRRRGPDADPQAARRSQPPRLRPAAVHGQVPRHLPRRPHGRNRGRGAVRRGAARDRGPDARASQVPRTGTHPPRARRGDPEGARLQALRLPAGAFPPDAAPVRPGVGRPGAPGRPVRPRDRVAAGAPRAPAGPDHAGADGRQGPRTVQLSPAPEDRAPARRRAAGAPAGTAPRGAGHAPDRARPPQEGPQQRQRQGAGAGAGAPSGGPLARRGVPRPSGRPRRQAARPGAHRGLCQGAGDLPDARGAARGNPRRLRPQAGGARPGRHPGRPLRARLRDGRGVQGGAQEGALQDDQGPRRGRPRPQGRHRRHLRPRASPRCDAAGASQGRGLAARRRRRKARLGQGEGRRGRPAPRGGPPGGAARPLAHRPGVPAAPPRHCRVPRDGGRRARARGPGLPEGRRLGLPLAIPPRRPFGGRRQGLEAAGNPGPRRRDRGR